MTQKELSKVIENHLHWLNEDCDGWENMRADLSGKNLEGLDFSDANLTSANLLGAILTGANLYRANLSYANLADANLYRANLSRANLSYANLFEANLAYANLYRTDLSYANLSDVNLSEANLSEANLSRANLTDADLYRANLYDANLYRANLANVQNVPFVPLACPDTGSFIGYKKAGGLIVQLQILEDSKRCSATSRKCRCDKAKVLSIQNIDGSPADVKEVRSNYDKNFLYRVGKIVQVDDFDEDRFNECSKGIHFFINRQDAVDW
jgi:uncharacterized protein YjbI with pentapeptide repeats